MHHERIYPSINPSLATKIDALSDPTLDLKESYAFYHELLWYGIDAVCHIVLTGHWQKFLNEKTPLENFVSLFQLSFPRRPGEGIGGSVDALSRFGIWFPRQRPINPIAYFKDDYLNRFSFVYVEKGIVTPSQASHSQALCRKAWVREDLENQALCLEASAFALNLWQTSIEGFHRHARKTRQDGALTDLGDQLIDYYSKTLSLLNK